MTDLYHASTPVAHANFRENTEKQAMLGVNTIPALSRCCQCGKRRTTRTGMFNKRGAFTCHGCGRKVA